MASITKYYCQEAIIRPLNFYYRHRIIIGAIQLRKSIDTIFLIIPAVHLESNNPVLCGEINGLQP